MERLEPSQNPGARTARILGWLFLGAAVYGTRRRALQSGGLPWSPPDLFFLHSPLLCTGKAAVQELRLPPPHFPSERALPGPDWWAVDPRFRF